VMSRAGFERSIRASVAEHGVQQPGAGPTCRDSGPGRPPGCCNDMFGLTGTRNSVSPMAS
jgi:hypothetical protein